MSNNTAVEARQFSIDNASRISGIKSRLLQHGSAFIEKCGAGLLPEDVMASARTLLQAHAPVSFGLLLRQHASAFTSRNQSGEYWPLVDACLFVSDATNDHWHFLSLDCRSRYLKFAEDLLDEHPISGQPPKGVIASQEKSDA